jgi:hypothetical protein
MMQFQQKFNQQERTAELANAQLRTAETHLEQRRLLKTS